MADIKREQGSSAPPTMVTKYKDMGDGTHALVIANGANLRVGNTEVSTTNPIPVDVQVETETVWTTLIDAVRLDDDPTNYNSVAQDSSRYAGHTSTRRGRNLIRKARIKGRSRASNERPTRHG